MVTLKSNTTSNRNHFSSVFVSSTLEEKTRGYNYYHWQYSNLESFSKASGFGIKRVVAAFCALSPNNAEATNYRALASCLAISLGKIPETAPVIAYGRDKNKALTLLNDPLFDVPSVLRGRKTYSFFRNTLDPDDKQYVTIDGHMYNIWHNRVVSLSSSTLTDDLYETIQSDLTHVADKHQLSPARLQAILWITWKRIHNIVSSDQLSFESGYSLDKANLMIDRAPSSRISYHSEDGGYTLRDISCIPHEQFTLEFGDQLMLID